MNRIFYLLCLALCVCHLPAFGDGIQLPEPTGPFAIGRVAYHWVDTSRSEPFSTFKGTHRELMVSIWYPAEVKGNVQTAPYLPDFATIDRVDADLKHELGAAYADVKSGNLRSHAVENAAISLAEKRYPVLIFSHGFGELGFMYTAMLEDLASHGYVIASIEHPYDAGCVVFPDGHAIGFAQEKWDAALKKPDGGVAYQVEQIPLRAADIRFVIGQIMRYAQKPQLSAPFVGRLDLQRIGVFGHSLGGMAAARACQIDRRIRVGMNQDADLKGMPFILYSPGETIKQPFCFMASDHSLYISDHITPPTDEELAQQKLTRAQYNALVQEYQQNQDNALAKMPAGSYRVRTESPGFNHRSFMDTNLLAAGDDMAAVERHRHNLQIVREYTLSFFDKYLRGKKNTLLDLTIGQPIDPGIKIERFGPAAL